MLLLRLTAILLTLSVCFAQPPVSWNRNYGGPLEERCQAMTEAWDGGYILAGLTESYGAGAWDGWLVKIDSSGDTLWTRTFGGPGDDEFTSVQRTWDGGYILAGGSFVSDDLNWQFWLVKTDGQGNELWSRTYGGWHTDYCQSVVQTADDGYLLAGYKGPVGGMDYQGWAIKTDANGDTLWTHLYGGQNEDEFFTGIECRDGSYIFGGWYMFLNPVHSRFWTVKTAANGSVQWSDWYGTSDFDRWVSVIEADNGDFIFSGDGSHALMRITSTGDSLWTVDTPGQNFNAAPASDGNFVFAGAFFQLCKISPNGGMLWTGQYLNETCWSFMPVSDGGYLLGGFGWFAQGDLNIYVVKVHADSPVPHISADTDSIAFGEITPGDTAVVDLTVANDGDADVVLRTVRLSSPFLIDAELPLTLARGEELTLPIGFSPEPLQDYGETCFLLTNIPGPPVRVYLSGEGGQNSVNDGSDLLPDQLRLLPSYPNPFNSATTIAFDLPRAGNVIVSVFDIAGRTVAELGRGNYSAGRHTILFDAHELPSGIYFVRLSSGEFSMHQKLALVR